WRPSECQRCVDRPREPRRGPAPGDMHVHDAGRLVQQMVVKGGLCDPALLELTENRGDLTLEQDEVAHEHHLRVAHLLERDSRAEREGGLERHPGSSDMQVTPRQPDFVRPVWL